MLTLKNKLIVPTVPHTLDCFNTSTSTYSNGASRFHLALAPADTLFVMGDNRNGSLDSRMVGDIDERMILGKAYLRLFPFNKIGVLK